MPLVVYTSTYRCSDPDRFDITRVGALRAAKSGKPFPGEAFAPSNDLLWPAKNLSEVADALLVSDHEALAAQLSIVMDEVYAICYAAEMRVSAGMPEHKWSALEKLARTRGVIPRPGAWRDLLAKERVVAVCFCNEPHKCHRGLLAQFLVKMGATYAGELAA